MTDAADAPGRPAVRRIPARTRAFEALFESTFQRAAALDAYRRPRPAAEPLDPAEIEYGEDLVIGVASRLREIDAILDEAADRDLSQMPLVDLTVLRIALYELLFNNERRSELPVVRRNIVVKEAVALARRYGADGSRRLVSGMLGSIARSRLDQPAPAEAPDPPAEKAEHVALFDKVSKIIEDQLGADPDEITLEASFVDDLGADSLDLVELIMSFEDEFRDVAPDLEISDEDAENIATVADAVNFLKEKGVPEDA